MFMNRFGRIVAAGAITIVIAFVLAGCEEAGALTGDDGDDGGGSGGTSVLEPGGASVSGTLLSGRGTASYRFTTGQSQFNITYTVSIDVPDGTDFSFYVFDSDADRQAVIDEWTAENDFAFVQAATEAVGSSGDADGDPLEQDVENLTPETTYYMLVVDINEQGGSFSISIR